MSTKNGRKRKIRYKIIFRWPARYRRHDRFGMALRLSVPIYIVRYTLAARVRTITRMNANEWQGQVFSETTNRGRAEGKSWIVVCTSCSSCTLDFGVIHLVGRCVLTPRPVISADYLQIDVFESHVAVPRVASTFVQNHPSCSSLYEQNHCADSYENLKLSFIF